jgi:Putative auto-transporter adhesin, head GIN domain
MKKYTYVALLMLWLSSCDQITGNGNIRTEKRNVGSFTGVNSGGSIDVEIKNGDTYAISAEDDDNLLPYIVTEINDGILDIHYKNGTFINSDHAKVYVTAPSLDKVRVSGSGDITIEDGLKNTRPIEMDVSGSGSIKGSLDAPAVNISVGGSGNIDLAGRTKDFEGHVSGSGDLNCAKLQSENATVSVSGSGNAHVFASVHLTATVSGSGDVFYSGNPTSPEIHTSGSGSVEPEK